MNNVKFIYIIMAGQSQSITEKPSPSSERRSEDKNIGKLLRLRFKSKCK